MEDETPEIPEALIQALLDFHEYETYLVCSCGKPTPHTHEDDAR